MLQITEDTPPDMLAGAMDLTVHLPTGRSVKMSVERSTPMMDLLVQITTNHHLQLSGYTLQALGMAPTGDHSDSILPYKPNTPIGALDTQHIKVIPKARTMPVPKNVPPGHQPFESTFRLKVHLPRNQLYVTRVSQSVYLEDIMRKVCEEKNLDPQKYELRHPGNLDEILDPKLTLSDYQITEVYVVSKGTTTLHQTFSTSDIMALRKEEERKQIHNKTGGGVFNLIFRRGKSSTGSLSSENRSISPTHSDDSRSVTPPGVQPPADPPVDRPKPPQRKRRPAPKPPQEPTKPESKIGDTGLTICHSRNSSDSSGYHEASTLSDNCNTSLPRRPKSTIINESTQKSLSELHSQSTSNLSNMSSYSKSTSSLAVANRRKKAAPPPPPVLKPANVETLEEPSPVVASQSPIVDHTETHGIGQDGIVVNNTNPVPKPRTRAPRPRPHSVISLTVDENTDKPEITFSPTASIDDGKNVNLNFNKTGEKHTLVELSLPNIEQNEENVFETFNTEVKTVIDNSSVINYADQLSYIMSPSVSQNEEAIIEAFNLVKSIDDSEKSLEIVATAEEKIENNDTHNTSENQLLKSLPTTERKVKQDNNETLNARIESDELVEIQEVQELLSENNELESEKVESQRKEKIIDLENSKIKLAELQKQSVAAIFSTESFASTEKVKPPEIVAFFPKNVKKDRYTKFDSYTRKRGFQIGSSLLDLQSEESSNSSKKNSGDLSTPTSVASALNAFDFVDEIDGLDVEMFSGSLSKNSKNVNVILNQLHGIHELESYKKNPSGGSLRSVSSVPGFMGSNMKKWKNVEELDDISVHSYSGHNGWVIGDPSDTESIASTGNTSQPTPFDSLASFQSLSSLQVESKPKVIEESKNLQENESQIRDEPKKEDLPPKIDQPQTENLAQKDDPHIDNMPQKEDNPQIDNNLKNEDDHHKENELEMDWQYQLPSPPKAFRDSSPVVFADAAQESVVDSVVTSPELFEKLKEVKDYQSEKETISDIISVVSEEEKPILNKLSLENLEKRKSLVYNRELATSLKISEEEKNNETFSSSLTKFEKTYEEVRRSSPRESIQTKSTLPNFKITTYDNPKQKLKVFEDDTIRSNTVANSLAETVSPLKKNYIGRSMENISLRKNSFENGSDDDFKMSNNNYTFYKPVASKGQFSVNRSESFKKEQTWTPSKPVTRSVSQVALNKYKDNKKYTHVEDDNLTKSNSLFDVSGLQSLGVMRLIQNKLNTPNNSTEQLDQHASYQKQPEVKSEVQKEIVEEKQQVKTFTNQYRVPSINMGTWSERPKIPVNVKEDPDYKYGIKDNNSKLLVNTVNNDLKSFNSIEIRNKTSSTFNGTSTNNQISSEPNNRNINNTETISGQNTGNVLIKIGGPTLPPKKPVLRKPLGNVNVDSKHQRPHSIAFGSDFVDISRVPIVRSVEFKKPYKEYPSNNSNSNNTSVTQIYQNNNNFKFNTINRTSYNNNLNEMSTSPKPQVEIKPVFRVNSYIQNSSAPVVRGFRSGTESNKALWNQPHSFSTLPGKNFGTNKSVPFSQSNLRRTESTKIENTEKNIVSPPPPPAPALPVAFKPGKPPDNCGGDPKEQLLQAIRNFGGKKGLKTVKV